MAASRVATLATRASNHTCDETRFTFDSLHPVVESVVPMTLPTTGRGRYNRGQTAAERQSERVEKVLDAATEVFAARGYLNTRVDDIVEAAGISRRTLYEDFESVSAIMTAVYERAVRINFATIMERLTSVSD